VANQSGDPNAVRAIKKLTLPDGSRVGIANLDIILKEVADLKLTDDEAIKTELLERVKEYNYIASAAADDYSAALFREYEVRLGKSKPALERHKHTAG
jgi:hypothetical protein